MNKLIKNRLPVLTVLSSCFLLLSCMNSDYDFDKVDYTLGFGGDEITLPGNNSTKEILLDDLLDISTSDLITTESNGDYKLFKEPDSPISPVNVNVNRITISANKSQGLSFNINLPAIPDVIKEQLPSPITLPYDYNILGQTGTIDVPEVSGDISLLEYEFDADPAIKSLEYVEVGENGQGVDLTLDLTLPDAIKTLSKLEIDLPDMLTMTCPSVSESQFNKENNVLLFTDYAITNNKLQIKLNVTRINVKEVDANNFVRLENGRFMLKANVSLKIKIKELVVPTTSTIQVSGIASFGDLIITAARGIFDPTINLNDIGTVNINSLPDFLTEEEVVADIDNPQIWLTLSSTMPLGGTIKGQLSSDTHTTPIVLEPIQVAGSSDGITPASTRIVICRHAPNNLNGYTPMIVSNLSELIEKLKEGMQIKFTVNEVKAYQETATVKLGYDYNLTPQYKFECPLAFGEKAVIVYTETENDWHKDIESLQLAKDASVNITATAISKIPADMELSIKPMGVNGEELSANVINIDLIKKDVAGTNDAAKESPIEAKVSGDITRLDGVILKLKAKSNEQLRGVTLNKSTQTLQLKDLTVKLVGKIIYDAN